MQPSLKEDRKENIRSIFSTMNYGTVLENIQEGLDWIEKEAKPFLNKLERSSSNEVVTVKSVVENNAPLCTVYFSPTNDDNEDETTKETDWITKSWMKKRNILLNLADKIEENSNLFVQIEILSRGFLAKETKQLLKMLIDSIRHFSNLTKEFENIQLEYSRHEFLKIDPIINLGQIVYCLAHKMNKLILSVEPEVSLVATLFLKLAYEVGIPEDAIVLKIVSTKQTSDGKNTFSESSKSTMIVLAGSDLDSASDTAINTCWKHQGLLPWSLRTVLVQESIFDSFTKKLKNQLNSLKVGLANDKQADIPYPVLIKTAASNLSKKVNEAISQGIEIYPSNSDSTIFTPTIVIGANINTNYVIKKVDSNEVPLLTVVAFRTIDEAVALTENCTQSPKGASIWSEHNSSCNELAVRLKTNYIWFNSHGLIDNNILFEGFKSNFEIILKNGDKHSIRYSQLIKDDLKETMSNIQKLTIQTKKAQLGWSKVSKLDKLLIINKFITFLEKSNNTNKQDHLNFIIDFINLNENNDLSLASKGVMVTASKQPLGVIQCKLISEYVLHLIVGAILEGNSVIVIHDDNENLDLLKKLAEVLPNGILLFKTESITKTLLDIKSFDPKSVRRFVTSSKFIYNSLGESSQFKI